MKEIYIALNENADAHIFIVNTWNILNYKKIPELEKIEGSNSFFYSTFENSRGGFIPHAFYYDMKTIHELWYDIDKNFLYIKFENEDQLSLAISRQTMHFTWVKNSYKLDSFGNLYYPLEDESDTFFYRRGLGNPSETVSERKNQCQLISEEDFLKAKRLIQEWIDKEKRSWDSKQNSF